jgi:hypothetical protein
MLTKLIILPAFLSFGINRQSAIYGYRQGELNLVNARLSSVPNGETGNNVNIEAHWSHHPSELL